MSQICKSMTSLFYGFCVFFSSWFLAHTSMSLCHTLALSIYLSFNNQINCYSLHSLWWIMMKLGHSDWSPSKGASGRGGIQEVENKFHLELFQYILECQLQYELLHHWWCSCFLILQVSIQPRPISTRCGLGGLPQNHGQPNRPTAKSKATSGRQGTVVRATVPLHSSRCDS